MVKQGAGSPEDRRALGPSMSLQAIARSIGCAALAAGLALPAAAQVDAPPVTYPAVLDRTTIASWLGKETDVRPETVAAVTPEAVIGILQSRSTGGVVAVVVRGEVLTPDVFARDKILSWHATVQVDCAGKRVRQGVTTGYAARNLLFDGKPVRAADTDWRTPASGEPLDQVRRAVCEPGFQPPLTSSDTSALAVAPPTPAKPAPAVVPPAPKPKVVAAPSVAPAAAPAPKPATPAAIAKVSAQVAAAGSEAEAARVLERIKARFAERMASLDTRIARAVVDGKTYYRALVLGFADKAAAAAFCVALQTGDQACFVRGDLG